MKHTTTCPAYNTKDRELADKPCDCGYRARVQADRDMPVDELLSCFPEFYDEVE